MFANSGRSRVVVWCRLSEHRQPRDDGTSKVSDNRNYSSKEPYGERTRTGPHFAAFGTYADEGAAVRMAGESTTGSSFASPLSSFSANKFPSKLNVPSKPDRKGKITVFITRVNVVHVSYNRDSFKYSVFYK